MADKFKLPVRIEPNETPSRLAHKTKLIIDRLVEFVDNINEKVEAFDDLETGSLSVTDTGSASTPSVALGSGLGVYEVTTNTLGIATNSTKNVQVDGSGYVTKPNTALFHATNAGGNQVLTWTGVETKNITVQFTSEAVDSGSDFNTSTYTFTAPVDGRYLFYFSINMKSESATQISNIQLITTGGADNWKFPTDHFSDSNGLVFSGSIVKELDASDTAYIRIQKSGNTPDTITITGSECSFGGTLIT